MISTSGMSSMLALTLIDRERDKFEDGIKNDVISKREISAFKERIGSIGSIDELQDDYEVYSFVMKTFGLEDQMFAKAMVSKILSADAGDPDSLVNRLTDPAFKELNQEMGFDTDGKAGWRLENTMWADSMVEKYIDRRMIDTQMETKTAVGKALHFEEKAATMTSWFKVLGDKDVSEVLRTALGIPASVATADVDAQKKLFERKMDISDLQDPDKVKDLMRRYAAISDANDAVLNPSSAALTLLTSSMGSGGWAMVTLDIDAVNGFNPRAFR